MIRSLKELENFAIHATDGDIGHVKDFYFDDESWVIRYLVVDTGTWLSSRKVLISPVPIGPPDLTKKVIPASITKEQVKNSPDIDTDKPVSRQDEVRYLGYYGYPYYWGGAGLWGGGMFPNTMMPGYDGFVPVPNAVRPEIREAFARTEEARHENDDPHLRSFNAVMGHHIEATDGDIGHVQGLLVEEETWAVRYLVVETSNWWLGHQVLIAPDWIENVSWHDATVVVKMTRQEIKDSPSYDAAMRLERWQETAIHEHYGRTCYLVGDMRPDPGEEAVRPAAK